LVNECHNYNTRLRKNTFSLKEQERTKFGQKALYHIFKSALKARYLLNYNT